MLAKASRSVTRSPVPPCMHVLCRVLLTQASKGRDCRNGASVTNFTTRVPIPPARFDSRVDCWYIRIGPKT